MHLLRFDGLVGVDHQEIEFRAHGQVLLQNAALENAKAFIRVGRETQIHARLEILQLRAAVQNALEGDFQEALKKKTRSGMAAKL